MKKKNYSKHISLKRINEDWLKEKSWIIRDTPLFKGMFTTKQELPENAQFFNCTFLGEKKRQRWELCIQTSRSQVSHKKKDEITGKAATLIEDKFWMEYTRYPKTYLKDPEMKFPVFQNKTLSEWKKEQYFLSIEGEHLAQESCRVSPFIDHRMGDFLYITVNEPSITVDVICQTIQKFLDSDRKDWKRECTVIIDDAQKMWDDCCIGLRARECRKKDISNGRDVPLY